MRTLLPPSYSTTRESTAYQYINEHTISRRLDETFACSRSNILTQCRESK